MQRSYFRRLDAISVAWWIAAPTFLGIPSDICEPWTNWNRSHKGLDLRMWRSDFSRHVDVNISHNVCPPKSLICELQVVKLQAVKLPRSLAETAPDRLILLHPGSMPWAAQPKEACFCWKIWKCEFDMRIWKLVSSLNEERGWKLHKYLRLFTR